MKFTNEMKVDVIGTYTRANLDYELRLNCVHVGRCPSHLPGACMGCRKTPVEQPSMILQKLF